MLHSSSVLLPSISRAVVAVSLTSLQLVVRTSMDSTLLSKSSSPLWS